MGGICATWLWVSGSCRSCPPKDFRNWSSGTVVHAAVGFNLFFQHGTCLASILIHPVGLRLRAFHTMVYVEELDTAYVFGGLIWKSQTPKWPFRSIEIHLLWTFLLEVEAPKLLYLVKSREVPS